MLKCMQLHASHVNEREFKTSMLNLEEVNKRSAGQLREKEVYHASSENYCHKESVRFVGFEQKMNEDR